MHALIQVKHAKADRKDTDAVKEAIGSKNFDGEAETLTLKTRVQAIWHL